MFIRSELRLAIYMVTFEQSISLCYQPSYSDNFNIHAIFSDSINFPKCLGHDLETSTTLVGLRTKPFPRPVTTPSAASPSSRRLPPCAWRYPATRPWTAPSTQPSPTRSVSETSYNKQCKP